MNQINMCQYRVKYIHCHFGGVVFIVIATGPNGCGFNPSQTRRIFKDYKTLQHTFLQMGSKAVGPMS
jgi:hypothetical protein